MEKEYESLRQETLQWQSRRFDIMAGSIVGTTAMLGWIVSSPNTWSWAIAAIIPLSFLSCACFLNCLFNRAIAMIGTYLEVFHIGKWNNRMRQFKTDQQAKIMTMTNGFLLIYFILGVISVTISYVVCSKVTTSIEFIFLALICLLFILALVFLSKYSYPRESFILRWEKIKNEKTQI